MHLMPVRALPKRPVARATQRGLSIVELLVGITIGLFVVAAAALMVSSQLGENRRLLLETQLNQDLRATMDIITRELRRTSFTPDVGNGVWYENKPTPVAENTTFGNSFVPTSGNDLSDIEFRYRRRSGDEGPFRFVRAGTVIRSLVGPALQDLTDSRVIEITSFDIDMAAPIVQKLPCPLLCPAAPTAPPGTPPDDSCWPEIQIRNATVTITGKSKQDSSIIRTLSSQIRVRNDFTHFNGAQVCPE